MGIDHAKLTERLAEIVGGQHVSRGARELVAVGANTATAWLVRPGAASEIAEVLRLAASHGAAVMPVGTASRRQEGRRGAVRPQFVLDMKRMAHVLHLDETSLVVHAQAGLTGLQLEEMLLPRGLTIGDFPPAALRSTLGGLLAVRTPGKSSPRHGAFEDAVLGISAVLASGRTIHTRVAPRRATGPDLSRALLGSEGTLGVITSAVLRIHRRPEARLFDAHRFPSLESAIRALGEALRADVRPSAARVYDADEARAHLGADVVSNDADAVLVVATAGPQELANVERRLIAQAAAAEDATPLGSAPAELWWRRRSGHPVPGPAPTPPALQITAPHARLAPVYHAAIQAASAAGRRARAHVSRFDDHGGCVFVTLLDGERPDATGPARFAVERAARDAGGLLVGERDRTLQPYLVALKRQLDPHGILNPGVLG